MKECMNDLKNLLHQFIAPKLDIDEGPSLGIMRWSKSISSD